MCKALTAQLLRTSPGCRRRSYSLSFSERGRKGVGEGGRRGGRAFQTPLTLRFSDVGASHLWEKHSTPWNGSETYSLHPSLSETRSHLCLKGKRETVFQKSHFWTHFVNSKGCLQMFCCKSNKSYCTK